MAKAVVGLNSDLNFDPSLQTDEVDHDFFDNPLPPSSSTSSGLIATTIAQSSTTNNTTATHNNGQENTSSCSNPDTSTGITIGLLGISSPNSRRRNSFHKNDTSTIIGPTIASNNGELNGGDINNYNSNDVEPISPSQQVFSTGTLLACLNNPHTELLTIDVGNGFCDSVPKEYYHHYYQQNQSNETEDLNTTNNGGSHPSSSSHHQHRQYLKCHRKKKSNSNNNSTSQGVATTRIKLFDISDSSSDEDNSDESDEELNHFMEKYTDYLLDPASDSDITEVSPMSSLTASPLPNFGDDSNHSNSAGGGGGGGTTLNNLLLSPHHHHHYQHHHHHSNSSCDNSMTRITGMTNLESSDPTTDPVQMILPNLQQLQTNEANGCVGISSIKPPPSFSGLFDEAMKSDHNNGGASPSNSSCISSSCESTNSANNNNTSSISLSLSSATSRSGSSASSSCSSARKMSRNHMIRNHTFTPEQMKRIERENGILLKKIMDTQRHGSHHHIHHHHHHHARGQKSSHRNLQCSASIARQKQLRRIDHENFILMKRLQSAKPSKLIEESFKTNNSP